MKNGEALIYVGGRVRNLRGIATGTGYVLNPYDRYFQAHREDLDGLLSDAEIILEPRRIPGRG